MRLEEALKDVDLEAGTTYYLKYRNFYAEVRVTDEGHPDPTANVVILDPAAEQEFRTVDRR